MHSHSVEQWQHPHVFLGAAHRRNERRTWLVVALTAAMMVAEIAAGLLYGSMALIADGWHMSTHAVALGDRRAGVSLCANARRRSAFFVWDGKGRRACRFRERDHSCVGRAANRV